MLFMYAGTLYTQIPLSKLLMPFFRFPGDILNDSFCYVVSLSVTECSFFIWRVSIHHGLKAWHDFFSSTSTFDLKLRFWDYCALPLLFVIFSSVSFAPPVLTLRVSPLLVLLASSVLLLAPVSVPTDLRCTIFLICFPFFSAAYH